MLLLKNKKNIITFLLGSIVSVGFNLPASNFLCEKEMSDFDLSRDREELVDIFKRNWRALTGDDLFSLQYVEEIMHSRIPDKTTLCISHLYVKVLKEDGKVAGFTAYYMETLEKGIVLFLAVGDKFRGKGYGKVLIKHAIKDLLSKGSKSIGIWVADTNLIAKQIYCGVGFSETLVREGPVIYLEYCP